MRLSALFLTSILVATALPARSQDVPLGSVEFPIRYPRANLESFRVARNSSGEVVVVWRERGRGSRLGIFARRFSPTGIAHGEDFRVAAGNQVREPDVAIDAAGNFLVTWKDDQLRELDGRFFDADGGARGGVGLVRVENPLSDLSTPSLAMDASGRFVTTWSQDGRLLARFFDRLGRPMGEDLDLGAGPSLGAAVASNAAGDVVVAWQRDDDVVGRRLTTGGEVRGAELRLSETALGTARARPAVGVDGAGGFVAAWRVGTNAGQTVLARRFDASGAPLSDEMAMSQGPAGISTPVEAAVTPSGDALVVWQGNSPMGRYVDTSGASAGGPFLLSRLAFNGTPVVASDGEGGFALAFLTREGLFGRLLPHDGRGGILQMVDVDMRSAWTEVIEEDTVVEVGVLRTAGLAGQVSVEVSTAEAGERPATAGEDYLPASGRLTFEEGESFKTFPLEVLEDDTVEAEETLAVRLSDAAGGAAIHFPEAVVTLIDDDTPRSGNGPSPLGQEVVIHRPSVELEVEPRLAASPSGDYLAVWLTQPSRAPPPGSVEVKARLLTAELEPLGDEMTLANIDGGRPPAVTAAPDGTFFVTWIGPEGIAGRRVVPRSAGVELGDEVLVFECEGLENSRSCAFLDGVDVTAGAAGRFVVSWSLEAYASGGYGDGGDLFGEVWHGRLDADGSPVGFQGRLSGDGPPAVSADPSGEYLVVWNDDDRNLVGRRFDADGQFVSPEVGLAAYPPSAFRPDAAPRPEGGQVVVWTQGSTVDFFDLDGLVGLPADDDVYGRRVDAGGELGEPFQVNLFTPFEQKEPRVATAPDGGFVVAWTSEEELGAGRSDVLAQLFSRDGRPAGGRFTVGGTPGRRSSPDVATGAGGDFVVVWQSEVASGDSDVFARRFSGSSCLVRQDLLCLGDGRFELEVDWRDATGRTGRGRAIPLTEDTGAFWFFNSDNLELVVKVLDGRMITGHYWVFYSSLSNVEFELSVHDTVTGATKSYLNRQGQFASSGDVMALPGE